MNIFILGLPNHGRTTLCKHLANELGLHYLDSNKGLSTKDTLLCNKLKEDPCLISKIVTANIYLSSNDNFIIDNIISPKDFSALFDYRTDIVIFLNRVDVEVESKEYERIGVSVIRDYCFWLASAELLAKEKWLEYNFKLPGEESDHIRILGAKNSVFVLKSFNNVIKHATEYLRPLIGH